MFTKLNQAIRYAGRVLFAKDNGIQITGLKYIGAAFSINQLFTNLDSGSSNNFLTIGLETDRLPQQQVVREPLIQLNNPGNFYPENLAGSMTSIVLRVIAANRGETSPCFG